MSCKKEISVALDGLDISAKQIECQVIEGDSMTSFNSFDEPNTVTAKSLESKITGKNTISLTMPAHSVCSVYIHD